MSIYLSNRDGEGKTSEEGHYRFQTKIFNGNVLKKDDCKVAADIPTQMSVSITKGDFRIPYADYAYTGWLNSNEKISITASDTVNPRIDVIILYVDLLASTSPSPPNNPGIVKPKVISGIPSATPSAPVDSEIQSEIGAGNPYIRLAQILVPSGATEILESNITDTRNKVHLISDLIANSDDIIKVVNESSYPVGSIYINATDSRNPNAILKIGEWEQFGAGRVPVGVDANDGDFNLSEKTGGAKTHSLTVAQLPQFGWSQTIHGQENATNIYTMTVENGTLLGGLAPRYGNVGSGSGGATSRSSPGARWGGNQPHNNLQPYITVYMWKRIA